jgi:CubicO group peptidase (beta-lactamase class C family)
MKRHNLLIKLIPILFIGISLQAQDNTEVNLCFEDKVQIWLTENNVPGVGIGIIEDSKIKYVKVFGELKKGVPAPDNTIFSIASMTKPVTAMLTLKLVEAGQWDLDEPLFHYWIDPDVANDSLLKKLTTRYVLSHQTGFPNWRKGKLTFNFEPGTDYHYSGEGFVYLAKALEGKFKKSLQQLSDSLLFKPIGMKDTRYCWNKNVDESRFAFGHDSQGNMVPRSWTVGETASAKGAAGSLITTVEDYCKFGIYVMNGAGLSPKLYNDMIKPQVNLNKYLGVGLGWKIVSHLPNGEYTLQHGGNNSGVKNMGILLPKSKRGVIVFTNGDNGMFVFRSVIKESIDIGVNILDNMKGPDVHKMIELSDEILNGYTGKYIGSEGVEYTITKGSGVLIISGPSVPTVELYPEKENKFFLKEFNVQFEFIKDTFIITQDGKYDNTAIKVKK